MVAQAAGMPGRRRADTPASPHPSTLSTSTWSCCLSQRTSRYPGLSPHAASSAILDVAFPTARRPRHVHPLLSECRPSVGAVGPTAVAMASEHLLRREAGLGPAIAITIAVSYGTAIVALVAALSKFRPRDLPRNLYKCKAARTIQWTPQKGGSHLDRRDFLFQAAAGRSHSAQPTWLQQLRSAGRPVAGQE